MSAKISHFVESRVDIEPEYSTDGDLQWITIMCDGRPNDDGDIVGYNNHMTLFFEEVDTRQVLERMRDQLTEILGQIT